MYPEFMNISLIVIFSFELIEKYYFIQKKIQNNKKILFWSKWEILEKHEQVIRRIKKEKQVKNLKGGKFVGVCEKIYFLYIEDPSYSGFIYFFFS